MPDRKSINEAFEKLYKKEFQSEIKTIKNPYGDGCASKPIIEVLKTVNLENILKKEFFNIEFTL